MSAIRQPPITHSRGCAECLQHQRCWGTWAASCNCLCLPATALCVNQTELNPAHSHERRVRPLLNQRQTGSARGVRPDGAYLCFASNSTAAVGFFFLAEHLDSNPQQPGQREGLVTPELCTGPGCRSRVPLEGLSVTAMAPWHPSSAA